MFLIFQPIYSQEIGVNKVPNQKHVGEFPYEMEGRVEDRTPLTDFDDCTKWKVTSNNCEAKLFRTQEQKVYRKYSRKLIYKAIDKKAEFTVELIKPIELKEPWD